MNETTREAIMALTNLCNELLDKVHELQDTVKRQQELINKGMKVTIAPDGMAIEYRNKPKRTNAYYKQA